MTEQEIEAVARAFYETLDEGRGWSLEPESLKEQLRASARVAIAALDSPEAKVPPAIPSLVLSRLSISSED
jgi:hypothetical protein